MHGTPDAGPPPAPGTAVAGGMDEFASLVSRYRIDLLLVKRHFARLGICLVATLLAVAYNAFRLHDIERSPERARVGLVLILVYLGACLLVLGFRGWHLRRSLRREPPTMRLRVMQVVDFVHRWANLLLLLAAIGHGVLMLGTLIGLDLFTREGRILLAALAPTALVIVHGLTQIPTIERLCAIHGTK